VGQVWGGSRDGDVVHLPGAPVGAVRWGLDGRVTRFDTSSGLPSDDVDWVWDAGGATWLGTRAGVARIDGEEVGAVFGARGLGVPRRPLVRGGVDQRRLIVARRRRRPLAPAPPPTTTPPTPRSASRSRSRWTASPRAPRSPWGRSDLRAAATVRSFTDDAGLRFRWRLLPRW
jgi:hypothetical protein